MTTSWIPRQFIAAVIFMERVMALAVLAGVIFYGIGSALTLVQMDWSFTDTFYDLMYRVLLIVIGLELVRMLVIHDLSAVLELLAFVTARKVLKPEIEAFDIILAILGFVALLAARSYFLIPDKKRMQQASHDHEALHGS